jgi:hypothetical protein
MEGATMRAAVPYGNGSGDMLCADGDRGAGGPQQNIANYFAWYDTDRPHSSLERLTPREKYVATLPASKLAAQDESCGAPELPTASVVRRKRRPPPWTTLHLPTRPESTYKSGKVVQISGATSGTDGPNLKDWWGNAFHYGWNQWSENRREVFNFLAGLKDPGGPTPFTGRIHFTGQSLGGALAQYVAYEFVRDNPTFNKTLGLQ